MADHGVRHISIKPFKDILNEFEGHIDRVFGTRYILHGHEPRDNPMAWQTGNGSIDSKSRGVDSDLLLIFEDRSKVTASRKVTRWQMDDKPLYDNIAFVFNHDDADPNGVNVAFSRRVTGKIQCSTAFSSEVFKRELKRLNRAFRNQKSLKPGPKQLMGLLEDAFMQNPSAGIEPNAFDADIQYVKEKWGEKLQKLQANMQEESDALVSAKKERARIVDEIDAVMKDSEEEKRIAELQRQLAALKAKRDAKKEALRQEKGLRSWENKVSTHQSHLKDMDRKLRHSVAYIRINGIPFDYKGDQIKAVEQWLQSFEVVQNDD